MRVFTQEYLKFVRDADGEVVLDSFGDPVYRTRMDLEKLLGLTMCSEACPERDTNIEAIKLALNGGVKYSRKDVLDDIKAGEADISDMGGMN